MTNTINMPTEIEIFRFEGADGCYWLAWSEHDKESYAIPGTWHLHTDDCGPGLAGIKAIECGWLAENGKVKVVKIRGLD